MKKITQKNTIYFYRYMCKKFGAKITKTNNSKIDDLEEMLGLIGIPLDSFTDKFAITLGRRIFVPWTPGKGNEKELRKQIVVLCHELIHVCDFKRHPLLFPVQYIARHEKRAHYEARACHANLEMYYYLTGRRPSVHNMINGLKAYRLTKTDLKVTQKHLEIVSKAIVKGKGSHPVTRAAMQWWAA